MTFRSSRLPTAFLRTFNYGAITLPWGTVYMLPETLANEGLRSHEQVHLDQIERDGAVTWTVKALWYLVRYGYENSPYEIEARQLSGVR